MFPGLRAVPDTDLSLAFAWRYWHAPRSDGQGGVVLPRAALGGRASETFRRMLHHCALSPFVIMFDADGYESDLLLRVVAAAAPTRHATAATAKITSAGLTQPGTMS